MSNFDEIPPKLSCGCPGTYETCFGWCRMLAGIKDQPEIEAEASNVVYLTFPGTSYPANAESALYGGLRAAIGHVKMSHMHKLCSFISTVSEMRSLDREYKRTGDIKTAEMLLHVESAVDAQLEDLI